MSDERRVRANPVLTYPADEQLELRGFQVFRSERSGVGASEEGDARHPRSAEATQ